MGCKVKGIDEHLKTSKVLDLKHLNGKIENFLIKGPNVTTLIKRLAFVDHRGLEVTNLTAGFTYTKTNILLNNLEETSQMNYKILNMEYNKALRSKLKIVTRRYQ